MALYELGRKKRGSHDFAGSFTASRACNGCAELPDAYIYRHYSYTHGRGYGTYENVACRKILERDRGVRFGTWAQRRCFLFNGLAERRMQLSLHDEPYPAFSVDLREEASV